MIDRPSQALPRGGRRPRGHAPRDAGALALEQGEERAHQEGVEAGSLRRRRPSRDGGQVRVRDLYVGCAQLDGAPRGAARRGARERARRSPLS